MPWFSFTRAFDHRAGPRRIVAYPAGATLLVPTAAARAAATAGAGRIVAKPGPAAPGEVPPEEVPPREAPSREGPR